MKRTQLNEDEVIALYQKLDSTIKVAQHFGVCDETIRRILIRRGIQRRKPKENKQNTTLVSNCHTKLCHALVVFCVKCGYDAIPASNITGYPCGSVSQIFKLKTGMTVGEYLHDGKGNRSHPKKLAKDTLKDLYINKKMMQYEIASMFDMSQAYVKDLIKKYGIQPEDGHTSFRYRAASNGKGGSHGINKGIMRKIEAGKRRCIERLKQYAGGQFEYVSGYRNRSTPIIIRCTRCGTERSILLSTMYKYNTQCSECNSKSRAIDSLHQLLLKRLDYVRELEKDKVCKCCGKHFHDTYKQVYCSDKCQNRYRQISRGVNHVRRAMKHGAKYEYGITLKSVIKRFNNICQICGKPCDSSDRSYGSSGPLYPSIDHIIPIARGGSHTWDNVQLAHVYCNSVKGAQLSA